jgi:hypothetical protein
LWVLLTPASVLVNVFMKACTRCSTPLDSMQGSCGRSQCTTQQVVQHGYACHDLQSVTV